MTVITETEVKKDARNRITLPAEATFDHYLVKTFADGHIELRPRAIYDPTISLFTLQMIDEAVANMKLGLVGPPVDFDEVDRLLDNLDAIDAREAEAARTAAASKKRPSKKARTRRK
jgi:hypothetical protein